MEYMHILFPQVYISNQASQQNPTTSIATYSQLAC